MLTSAQILPLYLLLVPTAPITVTAPAYMAPMFSEQRGHLMLLGAAIWMSLGIFVMRKMINFDF